MHVRDLFDLSGQTAVVTGGGSGLGLAMATALAEAGANLVLPDANGEAAEAAAASIVALGREALPWQLDVADQAAVGRCFAAAGQRFGRLDILVNNAGASHNAPTAEVGIDEWRRVFDVNVNGALFCCQQASRYMLEQRRGKIINIASIYGLVGIDERLYLRDDGRPHQSLAYTATKGTLVQMTRSLAIEWARAGITVNAIAPGMMRTPRLARRINPPTWERLVDRTPLGRWGETDDLKGAVVYLASRASDFVTGHVLVVDGGWTVW